MAAPIVAMIGKSGGNDSHHAAASVLAALLTNDPLTARAEAYLRTSTPLLILSDFAAAEFACALARRVRSGEITAAEGFLRRLRLTLRTPDVLNIAIAERAGATLATFDEKMARAARTLRTRTIAWP
ncbi:MAG: hypothetical protein ACREFU_21175 [Acetobacteraceae bacterium]